MEVLRFGYHLPFLSTLPLSAAPIPMPSYSPTSIKGAALEDFTLGLIVKGAVELAPLPSPGFYSRLFVLWKTSGSWRPVIDLSYIVVDFVVVLFMIFVDRCMAILAFCYDVSHVLFCLLILSGDVELHPGPRLTGRPQCRVMYSNI